MPGRRKDLRPKSGRDAPGSGAYSPNVNPMKRSTPSYSLTKTIRNPGAGRYDATPGMGDYKIDDRLVKT
jgi:hypothetical protein